MALAPSFDGFVSQNAVVWRDIPRKRQEPAAVAHTSLDLLHHFPEFLVLKRHVEVLLTVAVERLAVAALEVVHSCCTEPAGTFLHQGTARGQDLRLEALATHAIMHLPGVLKVAVGGTQYYSS